MQNRRMIFSKNKILGNIGESVACQYLEKNGYKIIEKNFRISFGEIDIVAKKRDIMIFVEVKSSYRGKFLPEENITDKKKKKLIQLAKTYLTIKKYKANQFWQIDVIAIEFKNRKRCALRHTKNAVMEL